MTRDSGPPFLEQLRDFAAGITPLATFNDWLATLLRQGPMIHVDDVGEPSAEFSYELNAAMYLDMVTDLRDPNHDESEGRQLAGRLAAIFAQTADTEGRPVLAHLARWAPRTADGIRKYLSGTYDRAAFQRFVDRRPWPEGLRSTVSLFDDAQLRTLAAGLEANDYRLVAEAFEEMDEPLEGAT